MNRILWMVLTLAIGISLYVIFRPAMSSQTQAVVQTISDLNGVDSSSHSDFTYSAPNTTDDTISITGYKGHEEILIIPEYRKIGSIDYKITGINGQAFEGNTSINQVIIPDGVCEIGYNAFYGDSNLKSLTLGSGVTSIGNAAFAYTALTSVDCPDNVKTIGTGAFCGDSKLNSLTLGSGVTKIGQGAFAYTALTRVNFPASLKAIGDDVFVYTPLSAISFKSPVALGNGSFQATKLTNVTLPTGSTYNTGSNSTFDSNVTVTIK